MYKKFFQFTQEHLGLQAIISKVLLSLYINYLRRNLWSVGIHNYNLIFFRLSVKKLPLKHVIWARTFSGADAVNALRPFYFAVHPDFFGQHPRERVKTILSSGFTLPCMNWVCALELQCLFDWLR